MFFAIKEERESVESKYFWHISLFRCFYGANVGIIFDTSKFWRNKFKEKFTFPLMGHGKITKNRANLKMFKQKMRVNLKIYYF